MLIQSSSPALIEFTPFYASDYGKQIPATEIWQMCPKCHQHTYNCCKEAASTEEKEITNCSCLLSFPRRTHPPTISKMSENYSYNFVYRRKKLRGNSVDFFSTLTKRTGEDCVDVTGSDGPSVAIEEQHVVSEDEHETEDVRVPPMPPIVCNGAESSHPLSVGRSPHLRTINSLSESSSLNFVYGRKKPRENSATFLPVPAAEMTKRREDCLPVISSDGPSTVLEERRVISQREHGTGLMLPPVSNRDDSSCLLSLPRSPQLPTVSTLSESYAHNFVYSRKKMRGNSVTFLSGQVPGITKKSGEDCLSVISSDGPSVAVQEPLAVSQDRRESEAGGPLPMPPLVCNGETHVSKSESISGCSLVEDLGSGEASKNTRPKIIEVDSINDSCSSSKSNMELASASTQTRGDDNGECSSSSVMAAEVTGEDQSEKDQGISILRRQGSIEGVCPGRTRASAKRIGGCTGTSNSRSCKKCFRTESPVKMLICDNCEDAFHISCCNPRVKRIPSDEWLCGSCMKKKRIIPKETISKKPLNIIGDRGRCRSTSSTGESNPIALMLRDTEPYTSGVRVGKGFQVEVPDWTGPSTNDIDTIGEPVVLDPSFFVNIHELKSSELSSLDPICNWLQCRHVKDGAGEGDDVAICGKWRRAPLSAVQTDNWECYDCVSCDPTHADCEASQELETEGVMKQLKYVQTLRHQIAAKRRKFKRAKNCDSANDSDE